MSYMIVFEWPLENEFLSTPVNTRGQEVKAAILEKIYCAILISYLINKYLNNSQSSSNHKYRCLSTNGIQFHSFNIHCKMGILAGRAALDGQTLPPSPSLAHLAVEKTNYI